MIVAGHDQRPWEREAPLDKPVASAFVCLPFAREERESPLDKPVASSEPPIVGHPADRLPR